uniref:RING-type domain-containing protein n=1 Tax=Leersia perrieri TaxID=77586 RepID=A0A0D9XG23_9ORYZ
MADSKGSGAAAGDKPGADANPATNPAPTPAVPAAFAAATGGGDGDAAAAAAAAAAEAEGRRPFTALSQVDADLALARVLQEQERAYMMLRMGGGIGEGGDYGSSDGGSYEYDDEAEDYEEEELEHHLRVHHHEHPVGEGGRNGEREGEGAEGSEYEEEGFEEEDDEDEEVEPELDPAEYEDDEAYARALQDAEEREVAARLMALAGFSDWRAVEPEEEHVHDPQELVALGEVVGTENRGLSADTLASLPLVTYKAQAVEDGNTEQCVICRVEFEDGDSLVALSCKHSYHPECINQWLQINKVCPMCSAEVSTSDNKQA